MSADSIIFIFDYIDGIKNLYIVDDKNNINKINFYIADYDKCSITCKGIRFLNDYNSSHSISSLPGLDPKNYTSYIGRNIHNNNGTTLYIPVPYVSATELGFPYETIAMRYNPYVYYLCWDYQSLIVSFIAYSTVNKLFSMEHCDVDFYYKYIGPKYNLICNLINNFVYIKKSKDTSGNDIETYGYNGDYTSMLSIFRQQNIFDKSRIEESGFCLFLPEKFNVVTYINRMVTQLALVNVSGYLSSIGLKIALSLPYNIDVFYNKQNSSSNNFFINDNMTKKNNDNIINNYGTKFKNSDIVKNIYDKLKYGDTKLIFYTGNPRINIPENVILTTRYGVNKFCYEYADGYKYNNYYLSTGNFNNYAACMNAYAEQLYKKYENDKKNDNKNIIIENK